MPTFLCLFILSQRDCGQFWDQEILTAKRENVLYSTTLDLVEEDGVSGILLLRLCSLSRKYSVLLGPVWALLAPTYQSYGGQELAPSNVKC